MTLVEALNGAAVEWATAVRLVISRGNGLFESGPDGARERFLGAIPRPPGIRLISAVRLGRPFLRELFYNVIPLTDDRLFVTFGREIGFLDKTRYYPLEGIRRPTRVLRGGCAVDLDGTIFWGEYFDNVERGDLYVYRWHPTQPRAEIVHVFARHEIYHVHFVKSASTSSTWSCGCSARPRSTKSTCAISTA